VKIKYKARFDSFPTLQRVKPSVPDHYRQLARQSPPPALPTHCKPWVDASSYGLLLTYPYQATLTVVGQENARAVYTMTPPSSRLVYGPIAQMLTNEHFSFESGYWFKTDPEIGIYTNHLPPGYTTPGHLIPGLVECWRYPKRLFVVFEVPQPGESISFRFGDPLCVLMPVITEPVVGEVMTDDELQDVLDRNARWDDYLTEHPELKWTSADGVEFNHMYKVFGRQREPAEDRPAAVD
jgi:hypothetical protein